MEVRSRTLGRALAAPSIGDPQGMVSVELLTVTSYNPNERYDPSRVTDALLILLSIPSPSGAPGC
jgi:hypothetical protein